MPTGYKAPGTHSGSIANPRDGAYREKNIHGQRSIWSSKKNVSIRSFSLRMENARYLDGVTKGHKSEVVNRAIEFYRTRSEFSNSQLIENIEALQNRLTEAYEKIEQLTSAGEIADNKAQKVSQSRGIWGRLLNFLRFST
jgi:hypothetical protein